MVKHTVSLINLKIPKCLGNFNNLNRYLGTIKLTIRITLKYILFIFS